MLTTAWRASDVEYPLPQRNSIEILSLFGCSFHQLQSLLVQFLTIALGCLVDQIFRQRMTLHWLRSNSLADKSLSRQSASFLGKFKWLSNLACSEDPQMNPNDRCVYDQETCVLMSRSGYGRNRVELSRTTLPLLSALATLDSERHWSQRNSSFQKVIGDDRLHTLLLSLNPEMLRLL